MQEIRTSRLHVIVSSKSHFYLELAWKFIFHTLPPKPKLIDNEYFMAFVIEFRYCTQYQYPWMQPGNFNAFNFGTTNPFRISFRQYYYFGMKYYFVWWLSYTTFMLTIGFHTPKWGYDTMWNYYNRSTTFGQKIENILGIRNEIAQFFIYMIIHALAIGISIPFGFLMWNSYNLHTIWCLIVTSVVVYNGGRYYQYVFGMRILKTLNSQKPQKEKNESSQNISTESLTPE